MMVRRIIGRGIKNKKGDIAITLLVIGVFGVCSFALLTFFISDFRVSNSFVGIEQMQKLNSQIEAYNFYKVKGVSQNNLNFIFKKTLFTKGNQKYFYSEIDYNKFEWNKLGFKKVPLFSVRYNLPS